LVALVGLVLRRLGRDPAAAWQAREAAFRTVFDDLRALIAQAEGLARDLDDKLAERASELRRLLDESAIEARRRRSVQRAEERDRANGADDRHAGDGAPDLAARVGRLARAALPVEEIARRLDVSAAEVRLLIGIGAGSGPSEPPRAAAAGRQK
jgi:hypothetical protein